MSETDRGSEVKGKKEKTGVIEDTLSSERAIQKSVFTRYGDWYLCKILIC